MLNVSVRDAPAELRAAVFALRRAGSAIGRDVSGRMRETMGPAWRQEVTQSSAASPGAALLAAGARIAGGNPPQLITASSRRKIGDGLIPDRNWAGYEYGANPGTTRPVTNSKGTTYRRHVMRHLPARRKPGGHLEPAAKRILPRVAAFWAQSVVKAIMDAAEGKG